MPATTVSAYNSMRDYGSIARIMIGIIVIYPLVFDMRDTSFELFAAAFTRGYIVINGGGTVAKLDEDVLYRRGRWRAVTFRRSVFNDVTILASSNAIIPFIRLYSTCS